MKIDHLADKVDEVGTTHREHEVRIRALELTVAGSSASRANTAWLWQAAMAGAVLVMAILNYLKP